MRRLFLAIETVGHRFFATTGIRVPRFLRRMRKRGRAKLDDPTPRDLSKEVEALGQAVERLEGRAYLEDIRRPKE